MGRKKKNSLIDCKIYPMKYLIEEELTEVDLHNIFDKNSLIYSLVINMFRHIGSKVSDEEIISMAKTNKDWVYENFWTSEQKESYKDLCKRAFKNIYQYKDESADKKAQWFVFLYGLTVKDK